MDFRIRNYICFVYRKLQAAAADAPEPSWNGLTMETPEPRPPARRSRFGFSSIPRKVRWIVLNNVFSGVGLALPFSFPFIQAQTGLGSQTIHVAALVLTDGLGFVMPVAFYLLLRDYRETIRTREARPKGMDWKPLLKFSGINGLIGLGAGFFIPLVPTWLFLKFAVPDTWSGPLLALSNVTIGLAATVR